MSKKTVKRKIKKNTKDEKEQQEFMNAYIVLAREHGYDLVPYLAYTRKAIVPRISIVKMNDDDISSDLIK